MGKVRTLLACSECDMQVDRWVGRCPSCGAWGAVEERVRGTVPSRSPLMTLAHDGEDPRRASSGFPGIDRVLGGGLMPATVALLAGEPGISK